MGEDRLYRMMTVLAREWRRQQCEHNKAAKDYARPGNYLSAASAQGLAISYENKAGELEACLRAYAESIKARPKRSG